MSNHNKVHACCIDDLCKEAHQIAVSKGWWDKDRNEAEVIALMHSELSEALEAVREGKPTADFVEELGDCCIRIFDYCGRRGYSLGQAIIDKMEKNKGRSYRHGNKKF